MNDTHTLQVMQETLRGLLLALITADPGIDRPQLAKSLHALSFGPGISPQAQLALQDLAAGMTAIAKVASRPQ